MSKKSTTAKAYKKWMSSRKGRDTMMLGAIGALAGCVGYLTWRILIAERDIKNVKTDIRGPSEVPRKKMAS